MKSPALMCRSLGVAKKMAQKWVKPSTSRIAFIRYANGKWILYRFDDVTRTYVPSASPGRVKLAY